MSQDVAHATNWHSLLVYVAFNFNTHVVHIEGYFVSLEGDHHSPGVAEAAAREKLMPRGVEIVQDLLHVVVQWHVMNYSLDRVGGGKSTEADRMGFPLNG